MHRQFSHRKSVNRTNSRSHAQTHRKEESVPRPTAPVPSHEHLETTHFQSPRESTIPRSASQPQSQVDNSMTQSNSNHQNAMQHHNNNNSNNNGNRHNAIMITKLPSPQLMTMPNRPLMKPSNLSTSRTTRTPTSNTSNNSTTTSSSTPNRSTTRATVVPITQLTSSSTTNSPSMINRHTRTTSNSRTTRQLEQNTLANQNTKSNSQQFPQTLVHSRATQNQARATELWGRNILDPPVSSTSHQSSEAPPQDRHYCRNSLPRSQVVPTDGTQMMGGSEDQPTFDLVPAISISSPSLFGSSEDLSSVVTVHQRF